MIRTVIQQKQSFTITLPKKWVIRNNIRNKSEIKIEENNDSNELTISTLNNSIENKLEISTDVSNQDLKGIRILVNENYRNGYDIIRLLNVKKEIQTEVEELTSKLIGFNSTKKENNITFETLTKDQIDENSMSNFLRKLFLIIKETYSDEGDNLDNLKKNMDTTTNYLRRINIKFFIEGKTSYLYQNLINKLSLIQHAIYRIKKNKPEQKINKILIESKKIFELLEQGLFKKDLTKINEIYKEKKRIDKLILTSAKKEMNENIKQLFEQIRNIETATPPIQGIILTKMNK